MYFLFKAASLGQRSLFAFTASVAIATSASAESVSIFDMRKSLPLDPEEQATREFYVNAGPEAGLRPGMFVRVMRAIPIHDPIGNKAQATMTVPVGAVKVIHAERGISVARPAGELSDDDRPTLEYEGIMIGDRLDMSSATMDEPKGLRKRAVRKRALASEEVHAPERKQASSESAAGPAAAAVPPSSPSTAPAAAPPPSAPVAPSASVSPGAPTPIEASQAAPASAPSAPAAAASPAAGLASPIS